MLMPWRVRRRPDISPFSPPLILSLSTCGSFFKWSKGQDAASVSASSTSYAHYLQSPLRTGISASCAHLHSAEIAVNECVCVQDPSAASRQQSSSVTYRAVQVPWCVCGACVRTSHSSMCMQARESNLASEASSTYECLNPTRSKVCVAS